MSSACKMLSLYSVHYFVHKLPHRGRIVYLHDLAPHPILTPIVDAKP